jgi:hypothetical protein
MFWASTTDKKKKMKEVHTNIGSGKASIPSYSPHLNSLISDASLRALCENFIASAQNDLVSLDAARSSYFLLSTAGHVRNFLVMLLVI